MSEVDPAVEAAAAVLKDWKMPSGWQTAARLALEAAYKATAGGVWPVAWLDKRTAHLAWNEERIVATNPEYVANNGAENFAALFLHPSPSITDAEVPQLSNSTLSFVFALLGAGTPEEAGNIWMQNKRARVAAHTEMQVTLAAAKARRG